MAQMTEPYMTMDELASYARLSRSWIAHRVHEIPNRKVGQKRLFKASEFDKYMEKHRRGIPLELL